MRRRATIRHRIGRRDEGQRLHEDFIASADPGEQQRDVQSGGAVDDRHGMSRPRVSRKIRFEPVDELADGRDKRGIEAFPEVLPLVTHECRLVQHHRLVSNDTAQCRKHVPGKGCSGGRHVRCCIAQVCSAPGSRAWKTIRR